MKTMISVILLCVSLGLTSWAFVYANDPATDSVKIQQKILNAQMSTTSIQEQLNDMNSQINMILNSMNNNNQTKNAASALGERLYP